MSDPQQDRDDRTDDRDEDRAQRPEEAHGGSMAPSVVDDTGHPVGEGPDAAPRG